MKFSLSTQEFNYLINKLINVVSNKANTLPILSNFLVEAQNDRLVLTATDLTVSIRCDVEAKVTETGSTTLPTKRFAQLLRELTAPNIDVSSNVKEITTLVAGASRFKINGMNKTTFPELPEMRHAFSFSIKQSDLKHMFRCTAFAVSKEDTRYALTGLSVRIANGQVTLLGTDGKRLARYHTALNIDPSVSADIILPIKAVDEFIKNLEEEGDAKVLIMPDKIGLEANNTLIITKLVAGEYPDVTRVIPQQCSTVVTIHREELLVLLRQVDLFTGETHSARFAFKDGELSLSSNKIDIGEGDASMPVNYHGPNFEIAFNVAFFEDILRHCQKETFTIGMNDPYNPAIIADGDTLGTISDASPLFLMMPTRLSEGDL